MKSSRETALHVYNFMTIFLKNKNTKACFSLTMNPNPYEVKWGKEIITDCRQKNNQEGRAYVQTTADAPWQSVHSWQLKPYNLSSPPGLYNPVFQDPKALQLGVAVCHVPDFSLRLC